MGMGGIGRGGAGGNVRGGERVVVLNQVRCGGSLAPSLGQLKLSTTFACFPQQLHLRPPTLSTSLPSPPLYRPRIPHLLRRRTPYKRSTGCHALPLVPVTE
jgi:hypothetical protein